MSKKRDIKGSAETNIRQGRRIWSNKRRIEKLENDFDKYKKEVKYMMIVVFAAITVLAVYMVLFCGR